MANQEHLDILSQGVYGWNEWRRHHPEIQPDLREAFLKGISLHGANLQGTDLKNANLNWAYLIEADLREADLKEAHLFGTILVRADLRKADLRGAIFFEADLSEAHLDGADLRGANLSRARLVRTHLTEANLTNCRVYGISAWDMQLEGAQQFDLIITPLDQPNQPTITVDNLEIAQFVYLLLNNQKIRDIIDTITSKVVLILGRFTPRRKRVLDALRDELRKKDYLPIVFDFDVPTNRNVTETVTTLARLSRFIIADITDPKSIPQELAFIVPDLPSVPVQPLLHARSKEYGMYDHFKNFPWVLPVHRYTTVDRLLASLRENVVEPAENRAKALALEKAERLKKP